MAVGGKITTEILDLTGEPNPPVGSYSVAFDLDGIYKKKSSGGVITPIEGGTVGPGSINQLAKFVAPNAVANGLLVDDGSNVYLPNGSGNFGIGTSNPTYTLDLAGTFKFVDGNQDVGKILVSDTDGVASWGDPISGGFPGNRYRIVTGETVVVPANFQMLCYGDLTLESGSTLTNNGQVVIVNGALVNNGGLFNQFGTFILADLALGPDKKYRATFNALANVPLTLTHNLNTLDFTYNVREGNVDAVVQITRIDGNNIELLSSQNLNGTITMIGY